MTVPELIGGGLALFQHTVDGVFSWGFRKLRSASEKKPKKKRKGKGGETLDAAVDAGRGALGFVAKIGESYYDEYTDLKKEQKK